MLLDLLDEAYDRTSWHGPNLRGALRGVTPAEADWRPAPGRHSIRELALHAAYWKYRARRTLAGDPALAFPLPGANWFDTAATRTWAQDRALLAAEHAALRSVVSSFPEARLPQAILPKGRTAAFLIRGIAAHDLYHAGQMAMLKRMARSR
ncbi:MAG: DinB family protein [Vicinamibacterales bacterium]